MSGKKRMSIREKYSSMTRDLDWDPTFVKKEDVYPHEKFEGIHIHDWDAFEDPFRLTVDAYWKYQAVKEQKLYAIIDSCRQNSSHLHVTDAKYFNSLKLFLQGLTPSEYNAHRGFSRLARSLSGSGPRVAFQFQAIDELRHSQTQVHAFSDYNRYYNGFHAFKHMYDRVWYLSVPKSFFDDAMSAGPFEFLTAISFSFEYVLTNLVFMPFMSGAAYNGDMSTVTFGYSAQSDEARHMTLGLEVIKLLLEQDERNIPIVQGYMDKWFWRGYRLLSLIAMMMDYMLPKKVMSWKDAWEVYFEDSGGALFRDLSRYGIRPPKYADVSIKEKNHISHQLWALLYQYSHAASLHTWLPDQKDMGWLENKYPESFPQIYKPRIEFWRDVDNQGNRFYHNAMPHLCQVCQIPTGFTEPDDPTKICIRTVEHKGETYHCCSDGCKDIFLNEPEKYVQAWMPVHQLFQGNCGGAELQDVLKWYHLDTDKDSGEYATSEDAKNWQRWHDIAV